jgi:acetoin utilization deacetylase AcuC-like enzyme
VTDDQLLRFHAPQHVKLMNAAFAKSEKSGKQVDLDGDTNICPGTRLAAYRAAGAACSAVDAVLSGAARNAFVAVRPPGHHAEPEKAMGFCIFGNAAIAALHARAKHGLRRVAVVDWDVHHGNGTQKFFERDADLFFASSHQMPCYPGTGYPREKGVANNVVNCALAPGSGSEEFRDAWSGQIIPALRTFRPELIIVSAGFDAHTDDPLAEVIQWQR